ncbi:MAG: SMP-30/gluconolactonase/LRE family protein [Actinomycetota bacterium]
MAAELEMLASGFGLIEGPRVDADDNLYFSDVPNGGVYRRRPAGEISVVVPKRRGVGGIALHADGGLVVGGRNICHVLDDVSRVVFEPGPAFNDLMTDDQGRVLCGTLRIDPFDPDAGPETGDAYRVELDGTATHLYGGVRLTNGIGFSPDGSRIYHADSLANHLICHDVEGDRFVNRRALGEHRTFNPDGLAVDEQGVIWVADFAAGCVLGLDPDTGEEQARIVVPANAVTSLCFGGRDRCDLYIVTADNTDDPDRGGTVFRTRAAVPGLAVPPARV